MGVLEIIIIGVAAIFLLSLWRGGGHKPATTAHTPGASCPHAPVRTLGCLGTLLLVGMAMILGSISLRAHSWFALLTLGLVGIWLLTYVAFKSRWSAIFGVAALVGFGLIPLGTIYFIRAASTPSPGVHWVDDLLDGPAAQLSPFHFTRLRDARAEAERNKQQALSELRRWQSEHADDLRLRPLRRPPSPEQDHTPQDAASLHIELKPGALARSDIAASDVAATVLAIVDLLNTAQQAGSSSLEFATLNQVQVPTRPSGNIPIGEIARLKRTSRGTAAGVVSLVILDIAGKKQSSERKKLSQVQFILSGVEDQRRSQHGENTFEIGSESDPLLIHLLPSRGPGIPVDSAIAAAPALQPTAPLSVPATVRRAHKLPEEGTWVDTVIAYQLLMWTLPESLGGLAEHRSSAIQGPMPAAAEATEIAVATIQDPPQAEVNEAVAAEAAPIASTPPSLATPAQEPPAAAASPVASAPAATNVRPAWMNGKPDQLGADGVFRMRRSTGRVYDTPEESHEAVAELLLEMTHDYAKALLGPEAAQQVSLPMHTILDRFVEATWDEHGPPPGLPDDEAWETHVLLSFDNDDRAIVEAAWREEAVAHNLRYTGAGIGIVLALLGTVFGYLKLDTATRGYYSGRLKLATGAVVAAITTLGILLAAGTVRL